MDQSQQVNQSVMLPQPAAPAQNNSRRTWIIAIIVIVVLILFLPVMGIVSSIALVSLGHSQGQAKDARIESDISQARATAEVYSSNNGTYIGFALPAEMSQDIASQGSKLVTQGLSDSTYVIYAALPNSGKIYCADANGFAGVIQNIRLNIKFGGLFC